MLCDTNDFRKIVHSTELSENNRKNLYEAFCEKRSGEEVRKIYSSFTSQEQKDLEISFEKHGYDINYKPVEATDIARMQRAPRKPAMSGSGTRVLTISLTLCRSSFLI